LSVLEQKLKNAWVYSSKDEDIVKRLEQCQKKQKEVKEHFEDLLKNLG
jgi:Tfp pilus assembly protein PilO